MRRIPRWRGPSGLASTTSNTSRPTTSSCSLSHFSSASSASTPRSNIPALRSRQRPTAPLLPPSSLARCYSSERRPHASETAQPQLQTPEQLQETGLQTIRESQLTAREADEILSADSQDLNWADEVISTSEGPYTAPPLRVDAARSDEIADPNYAPAYTAHGLKTVGGLMSWWNRSDHWDPSGDFVGFRPREKVVEPALLEAAVRQAVIEAFALREIEREDQLVAAWPTTFSKTDLQSLLASDVKGAEDGSVTLGGDAKALIEGLLWRDHMDANEQFAALPDALSPEEAGALSQTWDPSWKLISLADARIRFAVTKRVFQLTGQLVPDHELPSITTVRSLLRVLKKPPKPATLTQEIQDRHPDLLALPNVSVATQRITRGDKEKALGRLKITQAELRKRNLPLSGHGWARKGKEISRLRGGT
ncbi:ribosomal subunit 39S-domain-containing protein [Nemania sp. NC0429]|nr:ribosomal subunit 39S-domain-containing protein [Nemania sp. NC0429]